MKILAISDIVIDWIYSPRIQQILADIDLVIGCGDLPQYYLEFLVSSLDIPVFFVNGNHSDAFDTEIRTDDYYHGATNLHCKVKRLSGYTFAGVEGCVAYNGGKYQYSQYEMWLKVIRLVPSLIMNKMKTGHYLNVFVSHAPPWNSQNQSDSAHQGVKSFQWLVNRFQPDYHLHGHIHLYRPDMPVERQYGKTKIVNTFGYQKIRI